MYNNPYYYNTQFSVDKIDKQIADLEKIKNQIQQPMQPTNLTQNFQIAPNRESIKYVNSIEDVQKESVYGDTPFFSKDMSILWVKNISNNIKVYELKEIVSKDEKDVKIEFLQAQIEELKKGMIQNAKPNNEYVDDTIKSEKTRNVQNSKSSTTK